MKYLTIKDRTKQTKYKITNIYTEKNYTNKDTNRKTDRQEIGIKTAS